MAMKLAKNKKGIFFTMIAILIVTILFVTFAPQSGVTLKYKIPSVTSRVTTANDFVETIKTSYIPMALHASSYNALNSLSIYLR